jgi:hypothetical protein
VTGNAEGFARSQDRDRTDGRHSGLMGGVAFNRVASSGVLATWGASTPDERREPERRTRERRSRGSTHGATEGVRGCDVRVRPPQPKGAGGQQPPRAVGRDYPACVGTPGKTPLVLRQTTNRNRSCHGEKPWHPKAGAAARTVRSAPRKSAPYEDATPRRKRSVRGSSRSNRSTQGDAYRGSPSNKRAALKHNRDVGMMWCRLIRLPQGV